MLCTALLTVLTSALPVAHAQDLIAEIGAPVETGTNGPWARALATDDGWYMGVGTAGDFHVGALTRTGDGLEDWSFDSDNWVRVTDHGGLKDHAIRKCPDGSWLHVSSTNNNDPNDTAYSWRLSPDFEIIESGVVEENYPGRAHNDMASICSPRAQGAVFTTYGSEPKNAYFFHIDETANTSRMQELGEIQTEGGAFLDDAVTDRIILISSNFQSQLVVNTFDGDLNRIEEKLVDIPPSSQLAFWPQRIIRVGQFYVVAMMSMDFAEPGTYDTGDVWLHVFDEDFNLLEQHQLTTYGSSRESAMRPWVERMDDLLIVSYDIQTTHTFVAVRMNLDGVEEVDTGFEDDSEESGADEEADEEASKGGGCSVVVGGTAGGMWLALGMLVATHRRRRTA